MKNSYKTIRKIGQGQTGSIFLVQNSITHKLFAMKKVADNCYINNNQIQLLPTLKHPNIIRVIQQEQNQIGFTLYQQFASQGDLHTYSQKIYQGRVPQSILIKWLCQIALGLYYLHTEVRVLHRDIKSRNILVMNSGLIKIADFGASRQLLKNEDFAVTAVGTPYYLSPQAVGSSKYNSKSDIWGLGCIMFQLSTGKKPFEGNSLNDLIKCILNDEIGQISAEYSDEFRNLVRDMLQKNMEKRISIEGILEKPFIKQTFNKLKQQYEDQYDDYLYPMIMQPKTKKYSEREEFQKIGFINETIKTVKNQQKEKYLRHDLKIDIKASWNNDRQPKSSLVKTVTKREEGKQKKVQHKKYFDRSLRNLIDRKKNQQLEL